jgi:hypothetical protein
MANLPTWITGAGMKLGFLNKTKNTDDEDEDYRVV